MCLLSVSQVSSNEKIPSFSSSARFTFQVVLKAHSSKKKPFVMSQGQVFLAAKTARFCREAVNTGKNLLFSGDRWEFVDN